jgi:hypothetical protein
MKKYYFLQLFKIYTYMENLFDLRGYKLYIENSDQCWSPEDVEFHQS